MSRGASKVNTRFPTALGGWQTGGGGELKNDEIPLSLRVSTSVSHIHMIRMYIMYARECVDNTSPGWYFPTRLYSSRSDLYGIGNIINYIIWVPAYNIVYYYDSLISLSALKECRNWNRIIVYLLGSVCNWRVGNVIKQCTMRIIIRLHRCVNVFPQRFGH